MIGLISIALPSSTLFLTSDEAQNLLESIEAILPHSYQFDVADERLSFEEAVQLKETIQAALRRGGVKRVNWPEEGF